MPTDDSTWMLYGANGYTGVLIAEESVRRGMRPLLAGRREEAIRPLAERLGLPFRCFDLDDAVARRLDGVDLVLLAAGPFSATSRPVVDACLARGIHYLDITGEVDVFEAIFARDAEARDRGSVLMPGTGFDVVPSDCLAVSLASAVPDADTLELAFHSPGGPSAGTAKTVIENLPRGGAARVGGRIVRVPVAWRTRTIPFRDRERLAVSIPWGDVATAYRSTKIPNITVYLAMPPRQISAMRMTRLAAPILGLGPVQSLLKGLAGRYVEGPSEDARRTSRMRLWGRATSPNRAVEGTLETPEGYALTAIASVEIAARVRAGSVEPGAWTPAQALGGGLVAELPGCDLRVGAPA
jgi:short subunit dehydrogenase-like uncharacterized protein